MGKRDGGGGGDSGRKKGKFKGSFGSSGSSGALPLRSRGWLITCDGGKEAVAKGHFWDAAAEVVKECQEQAGGGAGGGEGTAAAAGSVADALLAEVAALKEEPKLFQSHSLGIGGVTYIEAKYDADLEGASPPQVAKRLVERAKETGVSFSRFVQRIVPIQDVCYASVDELTKAATPVIKAAFPAGEGVTPLTYGIVFEKRAAGGCQVSRDEAIKVLAPLVPEPHTVNLTKPDRTISVQVVKGAIGICIVEDYFGLAKYNVRTVTTPPEDKPKEAKPAPGDGDDTKAPAEPKTGGATASEGEAGGAGEAAAAKE